MATPLSQNQDLEIAKGTLSGHTAVNKFGRSTNVDTTRTDIHDGANVTDDIAIWVAPTEARIHNIASTDANDVAAAGTLTLSANVSNNDTITIASKVYKFQTTLTNVDGNVFIGAAATNSIDNLVAAINLASGAGTTYAASTEENDTPTSAVAGAGDTMTLYARTAIATTKSSGTASWGSTNAVLGTGARSVLISGLVDWDTPEVQETLFLTGVTDIPTVNEYVIIYRLEDAEGNVGVITATAVTDGTVTAQINVGNGQTVMTIFGIPSTQDFYMFRLYSNLNKATGSARSVDISLCVNSHPDIRLDKFAFEHTFSISSDGTSALTINYGVPKKIRGPVIVKISGIGSINNIDVSAGFDGITVTK